MGHKLQVANKKFRSKKLQYNFNEYDLLGSSDN